MADQNNNRRETLRENWQVMKPFVHFGIRAMVVIGGALIGIIKLLPMLAGRKPVKNGKNDHIIKIS